MFKQIISVSSGSTVSKISESRESFPHTAHFKGHLYQDLSTSELPSTGSRQQPQCGETFQKTLEIFLQHNSVLKLHPTLKYEGAEVTNFQCFSEKFANSN